MKHKYTTSFSSVLHCVVDEDKDKLLAKASLEDLKGIIPAEFASQQLDLLPIAFNACVVNRVNKNDDCIGTETALSIYKNFPHKQINVEHDRQMIIGHIVASSLSSFSPGFQVGKGSSIIDEASVVGKSDPFNICLAGVIYKVLGSSLIDAIMASTDPNNPRYMSISASWELGFDTFDLVVGNRDLSESTIITQDNKTDYERYASNLRAFGGSGRLEDGRYVFRKLSGAVTALGVGLTKSPAAEVQGLVVASISDNKQNKEEIISHNDKNNVKDYSMKTIVSIEDLKNVKQEELGEYSIASISEVLQKAVKDAADKYQKESTADKEAAAAALKKATELEGNLATVTKELDAIKTEQAKAAQLQKFNARMSHLDETFDLSKEQREVVANQIKDLDDAKFDAWMKEFEVLAACKKKSKAAGECEHGMDPATCPDCKKAKDAKAAEEALAAAKPVAGQTTPPNAAPPKEQTLVEKFAKAFTIDTLIIKK